MNLVRAAGEPSIQSPAPREAGKATRRVIGAVAAAVLVLAAGAAAVVISLSSDDGSQGKPSAGSDQRAGAAADAGLDRPAATQSTPSDVPDNAPAAPIEPPGTEPAFALYTPAGSGYSTRIPTGPGWSNPSETEPTPGRLFRTTITGPNGLIALIDYTPFEPAGFGGSFLTRRTVSQAAYGSAIEYVFKGGTLPQCRRTSCVDYIINDSSRGSGYGVLVGGISDLALSKRLARTMMENLSHSDR